MNDKDLRIVYMGTPDFAVTPLRRLVEGGYNVVAVVTTPDKPAGRGQKVSESAVKQYAVQAGLPILQPEKLKDEEFVRQFKSLRADLGIVIAFRMLPEVIWAAPRFGTFNLHASLLPQYRGAAPINWAIINGDTNTGVTTFMLDHQIDTGDMLGQSDVEITWDDNAGTLHDKLMYSGSELIVDTIAMIADGNFVPLKQIEKQGEKLKIAPKIFKEDCMIDWNNDTQEIHNLIRGLSPYPTAWTSIWKGGEQETIQVKIYASSMEKTGQEQDCGGIVTDNKTFMKVGCGDGFIHIDELQLAGKKRMKTDEFLRGFKDIKEYNF